MFYFLQTGATLQPMSLPLGNELNFLNKSIQFSSCEKPNSIIENFFNTSILLSTDKVIQWRTIENHKTISTRTTFLDDLINTKNKNFFYHTVAKKPKAC